MVQNDFYATELNVYRFALTSTISNIANSNTMQDPANPYYMGYIKMDDLPKMLIPYTLEQDATNPQIWHSKKLIPDQNYSWFYGVYQYNAYQAANTASTYNMQYRNADMNWTYSGHYGVRFMNGGYMSRATLYMGGFKLYLARIYRDLSTGEYSECYTMIQGTTIVPQTSLSFHTLAKFINGEENLNIDGHEFAYDQMDDDNLFRFIDTSNNREIIYGFTNVSCDLMAQVYGGSSSADLRIEPYIKIENSEGNAIYIRHPAYDLTDRRMLISGTNVSNRYNIVNFNGFGYNYCSDKDFDCSEIYPHIDYLQNGRFFRASTGSVTTDYSVAVALDPADWFKYYSLFNRITDDWSRRTNYNGYETDYSVNFFSDDNIPLFTGELGSTTYSYNDVLPFLQPWQYVDNDISKNVYNDDDKPVPEPPEPPSDDELTTEKHNDENSLPVLSGIRTVSGDAFSTFYHLSMYHVSELGHLLSQMPQTFWEALGTATDFKQSNLLDYLVSLKWYPLNIVDSSDTVTSDIQFGFNGIAKITFTAAGTSYKIGNINRIYSMGSITVPYRVSAQSFLDLEPYTTVSAYLPYIGTVSLQANDVLGYTITCTYVVDLTTGMCTGIIDNGFDTIYIGTGKIGVDISVSGNDILTQSEKMASSYIGAAAGVVNNTLSLAASTAAEDAAGMISASASAVTTLATSAINIANSKRGIPETVGSASGFGGGYTHQSPYIRVQRPAVSIPGKYGHDVGYVCNRSYTIGSLSGYTVCSNPDLSGITATTAELDMIRSILCNGFYA